MIFTRSQTESSVPQKPATLEGVGVAAGLPCALKETRIEAAVTGFIAEVQVVHTFENVHALNLDALYTFPLPHDAAVVAFEFHVDGKLIQGVAREKQAAREAFTQARDAGRNAGLVEQQRPNVFQLELANIPAHGAVTSRITYLEALPYENGEFELRVPTVVAPRYEPAAPEGGPAPASAANAAPRAKHVPHTLALAVTVDAGMPIHSHTCDTHAMTVVKVDDRKLTAALPAGSTPDRDVVLRWKVGGAGIQVGLVTHRPDPNKEGTFYMFAVPPAEVATKDIRAKEMILLVDRSGSMAGEKMDGAREAVRAVLRGLNPNDSFQIVLFDDRLQSFSPKSVPFTDQTLAQAEQWMAGARANGGTEVLPAVAMALGAAPDPVRQRVVVLITDGQVSNESQVLAHVRQKLGGARLFTVGIDTAVNTYLLAKIARYGRGAAEFVLPTGDIQGVIARLANRIGSPVLTDPVADFGTVRVSELTPHPLPDVMAGQVVVVAGKYRGQGQTEVNFAGQGPGRLLEHRVDVTFPAKDATTPAVEKIWARLMIDRLEDDLLDDPGSATIQQKIAALGVAHGLASSQTSLVAIDERDGDPKKAKDAVSQVVPLALPAGWDESFADLGAAFGGGAGADGSARPAACMAPAPAPSMRARSFTGAIAGGVAGSPGGGATEDLDGMLFDRVSPEPAFAKAEAPKRKLASRSPVRQDSFKTLDSDGRLRELAKRQAADGSWNGSVVETALVIATFARAGHTDRKGAFQAQLRRAVEYLERALASGWTAVAGSPGALAVTIALARLFRATGSSAHRTLAERFGEAGAKVNDLDGTAADPVMLEARAVSEARFAGVTAEVRTAFEG